MVAECVGRLWTEVSAGGCVVETSALAAAMQRPETFSNNFATPRRSSAGVPVCNSEVRGNLSGREVPPGGSLRMAAGMDAALCRSVLELDAGCRLMQLPDGLQQQAYLRDVLNELDSFAAVGLAEECDDA